MTRSVPEGAPVELVKITVVKYFNPAEFYDGTEYREAMVQTARACADYEAYQFREGASTVGDLLEYEEDDYDVSFQVVRARGFGESFTEETIYTVPPEVY